MGQLVITAFLLRSYVIVVRRFIQGETFPNSHCIVTDSSKALQNSLTSNLGTARVTVVAYGIKWLALKKKLDCISVDILARSRQGKKILFSANHCKQKSS